MKMKIEKKIKEIVGRVLGKNGFTLHNIFLFGSRARGDFDEESDYDILVILNEEISIEDKRKLMVKISGELHKKMRYTSFDIIIKSLKSFEEEKNVVNTVSNEAFLEGIRI
ncbi:MAG: hypothetical protein DRP50_03400 [Thermotoga sp.]|nr:MAG: hypothetical protein DRP50_03400 [Thermotoga sp.]